MGFIRFCDNQTTTGLFVEAVHNSWPFLSADSGKRGKMVQEGVHQRVFSMARTGMNHQTRWFVDHDQVVVFVKNVERDRLRLIVDFFRRWLVDFDAISGMDEIAWPGRGAV